MKANILHINSLNKAMLVRYAIGITDELSIQELIPGLAAPRWQFGHLAVVANFAGTLVGGSFVIPESWPDLFRGGTNLKPGVEYPSMAEIVAMCGKAHDMAAEALSAATPEMLDGPMTVERLRPRFRTPADAAAFMTGTHVGYHLGEVMAWRKAAGLGVPPA